VPAGGLLSGVPGAEIGGGTGTLACVCFLPQPMGEIAMINMPRPARTFRENLALPSTFDSLWPWDIRQLALNLHVFSQNK
jgi:hypothetical protein